MIRNKWTAPEIKRLRELYPVMSKDDLIRAFPRHPWQSIKTMGSACRSPKTFGNRRWREIAARHVMTFQFGGAR
jgi:hypothetical protein